ncbi:protein disulfide-isomerase TMX3 isoform X2 [Anabrus simplex]
MFYAPWCAHCKRLEPIWAHVAQALHVNSNIRVGRVDCTRFTAVANEFGVSGFPTISFLKDDEYFIFKGDRTKEEIINFALRLSGPPVKPIMKADNIGHLMVTNSLWFLYVGPPVGPYWETYNEVAESFQPHAFFYSTTEENAKLHVSPLRRVPGVYLFKDSDYRCFSEDQRLDPQIDTDLNASLHTWVNTERFPTFPQVTRGNIYQLVQTNKFLVLAVVEENKLKEVPAEMLEFRDMIEMVIRRNREKFHRHFQFGWIGSPELANSIAMSVLPLPHLIVLNTTTNHHHIPEDDPSQLTPEAVMVFLDRIRNQSAPMYGGNTLPVRLYRTYFEARSSLADMWMGNPVLTTVLFGLPLGFLTLICYSICCADIMDADDEEEYATHEKKE